MPVRGGSPVAQDAADFPTLACALQLLVSGSDGSRTDARVLLAADSTQESRHTIQFAVVPGLERARWLLPVNGSVSGALAAYVPFSWRGRLGKAALSSYCKLGMLRWFPAHVTISSDDLLPLEVLARRVFDSPEIVLAATLGTPGKNRKLLIEALRPSGELLGVMKLAMSPAAAQRIQAETITLTKLAEMPGITAQVPRVLYAGSWAGGQILVQGAAPSRRSPRQFRACHQRFLDKLLAASLRTRYGAEFVDDVAQYCRKHSPAGANNLVLIERALLRADRALRRQYVECGLSHGDFAPWNLRLDQGEVFALDWEAAQPDLPSMWDKFHFLVQTASLLHTGEPQIREMLHSHRQALPLFSLYLVHSLTAACAEGTPDAAQISYRLRLLRELV